jgi:hypothetical protein
MSNSYCHPGKAGGTPLRFRARPTATRSNSSRSNLFRRPSSEAGGEPRPSKSVVKSPAKPTDPPEIIRAPITMTFFPEQFRAVHARRHCSSGRPRVIYQAFPHAAFVHAGTPVAAKRENSRAPGRFMNWNDQAAVSGPAGDKGQRDMLFADLPEVADERLARVLAEKPIAVERSAVALQPAESFDDCVGQFQHIGVAFARDRCQLGDIACPHHTAVTG